MTTCKSQFFYHGGPKTGLKSSQLEALSHIRDCNIFNVTRFLESQLTYVRFK